MICEVAVISQKIKIVCLLFKFKNLCLMDASLFLEPKTKQNMEAMISRFKRPK